MKVEVHLLRHGGVVSNGAFIKQKITVEFTLLHRTNKLIPLKQLTKRQITIHKLIQFMHKEGMGYRRISDFLNRSGIKTHTNKTWSNSKVQSNLKRMQERKERIVFRNKPYPILIKDFRIK
jgi:DNA-binding NarL/FixJ family response regulator